MRATFIGDPNSPGEERSSVDMFGVSFPLGQSVDVSHLSDAQRRKLAGNRHFTTDTAPPNPDPIVAAVKRGKKR